MEQFLEFAGNHPYLTGGTVIAAVLVIVGEIRARAQGGVILAAQDAVQLINRGGVVLDTRDETRFAAGHILHARHIPLAELATAADSVHKSKEKPVLVYCDNGISGSKAVGILQHAGYQNVYNLKGGLTAWQKDNLPTVTKKDGKKKKNA